MKANCRHCGASIEPQANVTPDFLGLAVASMIHLLDAHEERGQSIQHRTGQAALLAASLELESDDPQLRGEREKKRAEVAADLQQILGSPPPKRPRIIIPRR
jgi:hypothetical protein